jgi:hypothetical protein
LKWLSDSDVWHGFIARRAKEPNTSGFQIIKNVIDSVFFLNYKIASWFSNNRNKIFNPSRQRFF